jgi:hypothetical protein
VSFTVSVRFRLFVAVAAVVLSACSGNVSTVPVHTNAFTAPLAGTVPQHGTVVLPTGSSLVLSQLTVKNSLGLTQPAADGTFTVTQFIGGPQFAFVTDPAGEAILAGFIGGTTTTIDATSTAQVYLYWSAGLFTLPSPYRVETIAALTTQPGFTTVRDAFANSLAANPDPFSSAMNRLAVVTALQNFTTALYASNTSALHARIAQLGVRQPSDVAVNPATAQSGITAVNDATGVHFVNTYRRSAEAFFDEASYVNAQGVRTSKPVTDAASPEFIAPVANVTNASGGPISVALGLLGGGTPYDPVTTATVPLSNEPGAQSTRYNVTVIGAGKSNASVTLTAEQSAAQNMLVVEQLGQDYLVPLVASITVPVDSATIDAYLNSPQSGGALAQISTAVETLAPQIYGVANGGDVAGALTLAMDAVASNPPVQMQLLQLVGNLISATDGAAAAQAFQNGYSPLYALNVLSAVLLSNDTSVASANISASDEADVFVVDVTPNATPTPGPSALNLYVTELGNTSLTVTPVGSGGNVAPSRTIAGSNTLISNNYGLAVDANGDAYLSGLRDGTITVYAPGASGNIAPIRTITGSSTGLNGPLGLAIDGSGDLVADNFFANSVTVFAPGATGNIAPIRTISGSTTGLADPYGLALDSSGTLYVVNNVSQFGGTDKVTVYAPGASGDVPPTRTITGSLTGMSGAIYDAVDGAGNIYVTNFTAGTVTVYSSGANGNVAPTSTIGGSNTGLTHPIGIVLDNTGKIYVGNQGINGNADSILVFAAGTSGNVAPLLTIGGTSTGVSYPSQMFFGP